MKKNIFIWVAIVAVMAIVSVLLILRSMVAPKKEAVNTIFVGPGEYKATFDKAMEGAGEFYDLYGKARNSAKAGDYESAIKLLNESLLHVGDGLEKGMVYKKLAEIYRTQDNLEKELFYVEEWPKYSMNPQLNEEAKLRAAKIRQLLATKNQ